MARPSVKRELVWKYLEANWPVSKSAIAADTGVSPQYAYMLLREYELIQKRIGNISSNGTLTRYKEPATPEAKSPLVHKTQQSGVSTPPATWGSGQTSDGSTASYYELPDGAAELQDLISYKNMNSQIGEIFRACYRMGEASHSNELRDAKKIKFYIDAEIKRLGG